MITNSKNEFFEQLEYELQRIGINFSDDIRADFEEHFAECQDENVSEEEAAKRLGDVKEIARNYLNLESTRINSMVARDLEHKVSLTKPGRDVPADLSLIKDKHEHFTEYTPEHFSEEIYPHAQSSQAQGFQSQNYQPQGYQPQGYQPQNGFTGANSENAYFSQNASYASTNASTGTSGAQNGSAGAANTAAQNRPNDVANAFSNAGRAVADAAKITGNAIADAFGKNNVRDAVANAGKTAADAVKTAGNAAAEAVKNAAQNVMTKVPRPNDHFRENSNNDRKGVIPPNPQNNSASGGSVFKDIKFLKPNLNLKKLLFAIALDVFLWSWLLPAIIGGIAAVFAAGISVFINNGLPVIFRTTLEYQEQYEIVTLFRGIGFCSLGLIISIVGIMLVKPLLKLFKFIIEMHIKAIYDL